MDTYEGNTEHEHEVVSRLYELAREGETEGGEFSRLDAVVYDGLLRTYGAEAENDHAAVAAQAH